MKCEYFGKCGSCTLFELPYEEQLKKKSNYIKDEFKEFYTDKMELFSSSDGHFRNRAEFRIWHEGDELFYAMNGFSKKSIVKIERCQIVEENIYSTMPKLIEYIKKSDTLRQKLFAVEFMSANEMLVTLIYHKKIDESWLKEAKKLEQKLNLMVIGRSRGVKIVSQRDFIYQDLKVNSKTYRYKVYENSFLQPNTKVNVKMIGWAKNNSKDFGGDLVELYCGHGNFTIPLSENFDKVLATEISKKSISSAKENCELNGVNHIFFARLSAEEFTQALHKEREFRRLKGVDLDNYNFSTIFIDPPRAGVDTKTLSLVSEFEHIIYISCNPKTLKRDLSKLCKTHYIEKFAIFDQFAYTEHLECGAVLKKIP